MNGCKWNLVAIYLYILLMCVSNKFSNFKELSAIQLDFLMKGALSSQHMWIVDGQEKSVQKQMSLFALLRCLIFEVVGLLILMFCLMMDEIVTSKLLQQFHFNNAEINMKQLPANVQNVGFIGGISDGDSEKYLGKYCV